MIKSPNRGKSAPKGLAMKTSVHPKKKKTKKKRASKNPYVFFLSLQQLHLNKTIRRKVTLPRP